MTLDDFRLLVARISLAAPLGSAMAKPKPDQTVQLRAPARPAAVRPA